jgi:hypothetical protein
MIVLGDSDIWSDTFPEDLVPRLLELVTDTWQGFEKPSVGELEVPITRRFKHALKQAKDFKRLPVRIEREPAEDDPETGMERGRIDLKFLPAFSAREEVYFAFECKRLNAIQDGRRRTLAPEYVAQGMLRFVTGQYAASMRHGGMIGYVLDGECTTAIRLVEENVKRRVVELKMEAPGGLARSSLRASDEMARETIHKLPREFRLHHLFLNCPRRRAVRKGVREEPRPTAPSMRVRRGKP